MGKYIDKNIYIFVSHITNRIHKIHFQNKTPIWKNNSILNFLIYYCGTI